MASSVPELLYVVSIFFLNRLIRKLVKGRHYKAAQCCYKNGKNANHSYNTMKTLNLLRYAELLSDLAAGPHRLLINTVLKLHK